MTETAEPVETVFLTADVIAVTDDRRVALIERDWEPYKGQWALPGGHVDKGETIREAAARELFEETGIRVDEAALERIDIFDRPDRDPRGRYVTVAYLARVPVGTVLTAGTDARSAVWWPLEYLPDALAFDHADILDAAKSRRTSGVSPWLQR
ncbi:NUDIX domain-containing protein [Streptomyces sp. NPDC018059]|uniref:NUDIX domain-containing protein n=1 Tax=Streptomyces sp. NPDC018059 TaxID=3365041 RepID=UPI0037B90303